MAFRHAMNPAPGPVYLELPTNVLWQKVEEEKINFPINYRTDAIPEGDSMLVDSAAELLANAKRPAAVMDDGARFSIGDHAGSIGALSDFLKMPVGMTGPSSAIQVHVTPPELKWTTGGSTEDRGEGPASQ